MFFDMGPLEMLTIFVIAIVVLGPEKLPKAISELSALIRKGRSIANSAQADIRRELGPEFSDLQLRDLHPRTLAEKAVLAAESEIGLHEVTESLTLDELTADEDGQQRSAPVNLAKLHPDPQASA
ncbi:Sec-independent protein translocase protein TatB [Streptomyces sp. NPDC059909]|uniref:Sec-independent protein translocase protein TatB n=1 Tax=Streptomyces sp. NPDC059909 TaxID=3346998 RepID=UPI00365DD829